jgi:general secretion pathway protein A
MNDLNNLCLGDTMYSNFFGFSVKPFELTPDPRFCYQTHGVREIISTIIYGIRERRGFIAIIGEPGTGKTTLLNAALDKLDREIIKYALIQNIGISFKDTLHEILVQLELAKIEEKLTKSKMIMRLKHFAMQQFEKGGNVAIVLDEAQNFSLSNLENLRLLSNLETRQHKLIQIVLAGQPELERKLKEPRLRQLAQRITLKARTSPFNEKDTFEYIKHRLEVARYNGAPLFGNKAKQLIWAHSQGVPRKINVLCDTALVIGYANDRKRIDSSIVKVAIQDHDWEASEESYRSSEDSLQGEQIPQLEKRSFFRTFAKIVGILILVSFLIAAFLFYRNSLLPN